MPFRLGQRWISDSESELGLGTVVALDTRVVTLLFSASNESRLYTRTNPPITRVVFKPGDTITHHESWQLNVEQVIEQEGLLTYIGTRLDTSEPGVAMREVMLTHQLTFSQPQDRLLAGQIDRMDRFALRYRARQHQSQQFQLAYSGLRGMRANLIPHQLHVAYEVGQRYAPRVMLADEVGLGKTIEAGMIIHQQLLAGRAERVIIIVPASLQHQWLVEMLRRFNLHFSLFDDERYTQAKLDNHNPFETEQLIICSLDFICQHQQRLDQLANTPWDLLIVDEAHHLSWSEHSPSREYQAVERLAATIPGVLLLTATPEQLGQRSHFARLRLLDPDRFHNYQEFVSEQENYRPVADAVALLLSDDTLSDQQLNLLDELISEQDIEPLLKAVNSHSTDRMVARQEVVKMLTDRHGTSRVLFRNTRQGVRGFPQRHLQQIKLPMPAEYQMAVQRWEKQGKSDSIASNAWQLLHLEELYRTNEHRDSDWWHFDPRCIWLLDYLSRHRNQKVLVICTSADTALRLEQILREREAIHSAVFHEGLSLIERDKAAAYFAASEYGAQVLLCSEIGSEGRNFQFAHHLIMFDLPANPDLLEQRIGRLDRIGQTHDIQILVPYLENSAQAVLVRFYHEALNAFEHTCPTGHAIYENIYPELIAFLAAPYQSEGLSDFIYRCQQEHHALKNQLEQGRDRLLEFHSNGGEQAQALAELISTQENKPDLIQFASNLFDIVGINQEDSSDNLLILTPSDQMLVPDFPGLPEEGCTITFDRQQALSREDAQFITWEHPMIRHGLDLILSSNIGSCAVSVLKNQSLPIGTLLLELIYVLETQAPKKLQLSRFLPPTPIRILLNQKGNDLAPQIEFESLNSQLNPVKRHLANKLIATIRNNITTLLQMGAEQITEQAEILIQQAKHSADTALSHELSRLEALRSVNPNIRDEELTTLEQHRTSILDNLNKATWRLDALRLIVVSHQ